MTSSPEGSLAYVDTSAYLKLLFAEPESQTLEVVISEWPDLVSSELLEVEMHRAGYREGLPAGDCDNLLEAVNLIAMDEAIRRHARRIAQPTLRAGDAIHVATAASLGAEVGVVFGYDKRLLDGALLPEFRRSEAHERVELCNRSVPPHFGCGRGVVDITEGLGRGWRIWGRGAGRGGGDLRRGPGELRGGDPRVGGALQAA